MRDESFLSANIQRIDAEAKHPQTHLTVSDKENHGMGFDGLEVLVGRRTALWDGERGRKVRTRSQPNERRFCQEPFCKCAKEPD